jgi:hypothetical protein
VQCSDAAECDAILAVAVTANAPAQCVVSDEQLQLQRQQLQRSVRSQQHAQAKHLLSAATKKLMLAQHAPWWGWVPAVTNGNANGKTNGQSNGQNNGQTGHIMANKPFYRITTVPTVVTVNNSTSSSSTDGVVVNGCELIWTPGSDTGPSGPETDSDCDQVMCINSSSSNSEIDAVVQCIVQFAASNSNNKQQSGVKASIKLVQPLPLAVLKLYSKADNILDSAQQHYTAKAIALTTASEITTALHDLIAGLYGQQACLQACVHALTYTNSNSNSSNNQQQQKQQQQQCTAFHRVLWRRGKRAVVAHVQCKYPAVLNVGSHLCAVTGDSSAFTVTEVQNAELEKLAVYKTDQLVKALQRSFAGNAKRDSYSSGGYNYGSSSERPSTAYSARADDTRSASNSVQQLYADWCCTSNTTTATTSTTCATADSTAITAATTAVNGSDSSADTLLLWEVHGLQTVEHYKLECATRKLNYEAKLNLNLKLANRPHLSASNAATAVVNSALTLAHPSVTEQAVAALKQQQQQYR